MIKLISACNREPAYHELADVSRSSIQKYCARHSFPFAFHEITQTGRPASWYKLKILREEMEKGDAEYYLWVDVDAVVFNLDYDLRALTRSGKEIYLAKDDTNINCGVLLLRKSAFNVKLLETLWGMTHCLDHPWWEQQALIELIEADHEGIRQRIEYVPQRIFNAYIYKFYGKKYAAGEFNRDSFVVHFPGLPLATRLRRMNLACRYLQPWRRFGLVTGRFFAWCGANGNYAAPD
ncbi:MAG TPA: hypothetical protein VK815_12280 [Candidatus Acidoferrales bacterium]|jgi:hypothetical protein|nr:hypothetical protein [Candidatus Acidoferrales bacterium]